MSRKGVFISDITVEMLKKATLESVAEFIASGQMEDIEIPDRPHGEWKRGRWEPWGALGEQFYNCSVCNHETSAWRYKFCPECGADMRKKEGDEK